MKAKIKVTKEVMVQDVTMVFPSREDEGNRNYGSMYFLNVCVDTGLVHNWHKNRPKKIFEKVCDAGIYELFDESDDSLARLEGEEVPHGLIPGDYGEYIELHIDENGFYYKLASKS